MKNALICLLFILSTIFATAQTSKKVLFIGNSYTAANDLPLMVSRMANSTNDILHYDSNTPGGFRLLDHASNSTTVSKINSDTWDYVVLQAQSQETAFSEVRKQAEVYPYAQSLSNTIRANNPCTQPLFYMTWGRKNGDSSLCEFIPWVCDYEGMDNAIRETYIFMSETNESELSPVGAVWRYIRDNYPDIDLYSADESHPSIAGSYAAASAFYTMIYKKNPSEIAWNSTLPEEIAHNIKEATKTVVYDNLDDWDFAPSPSADFSETINGGQVKFTNASSHYNSLLWNFGDSNTSSENNPIHVYNASGTYDVSLTVTKCDKVVTLTKTLNIDIELGTSEFQVENLAIFPNPAKSILNIKLNKIYREIKIQLVDSSGKILTSKRVFNQIETSLNVSRFQSGIYMLKVVADESNFAQKIVIE